MYLSLGLYRRSSIQTFDLKTGHFHTIKMFKEHVIDIERKALIGLPFNLGCTYDVECANKCVVIYR